MGRDSAYCISFSTPGTRFRVKQRVHIPSYRGRLTLTLNRGIISNTQCVLLLLSTERDTKTQKPVPAPRLLVSLLGEKTCTCKTIQKKKVVLDPESQKVVPTVIVRALSLWTWLAGCACGNIRPMRDLGGGHIPSTAPPFPIPLFFSGSFPKNCCLQWLLPVCLALPSSTAMVSLSSCQCLFLQ